MLAGIAQVNGNGVPKQAEIEGVFAVGGQAQDAGSANTKLEDVDARAPVGGIAGFIGPCDDDLIVARPGINRIHTGAGLEHIVTVAACERIVARAAIESVVAASAGERVVRVVAGQRIVAISAGDIFNLRGGHVERQVGVDRLIAGQRQINCHIVGGTGKRE